MSRQKEDMLRNKVAMKDALDRLRENPSFKLLIEKGFLHDFCLENAYDMVHPKAELESGYRSPKDNVLAVGTFQHFLNLIPVLAKQAQAELDGVK